MGKQQKKWFQMRAAVTAIVVTTALSIGVTGCAQEAPAAPATGANSAGEQDREASWFVNKMRVCISNKTAQPITLFWGEYMQGDDGEYLPEEQRRRTLGPDAFNCAVSYAGAGNEDAYFALQETATSFRLLNDWTSSGYYFYIDEPRYDEPYSNRIYPSQTQDFEATTSSGQRLTLRVTLKETLRKVGNVEAYPVDVRIISASN